MKKGIVLNVKYLLGSNMPGMAYWAARKGQA